MKIMRKDDIEKLEVDLLVNVLYQRYGYDFRHYAQASLWRRIKHFLAKTGEQGNDHVNGLAALWLHTLEEKEKQFDWKKGERTRNSNYG